MSTMSGGPNIITDGLVLHLDANFTKSNNGTTTWYDLSKNGNHGTISGGNDTAFGSSYSWSNNIENITICIILKKTAIVTDYAIHPINKWNSAYNNNASFILYHFGTYGGANPNSDGGLGFYGNMTAENGTGWGSISGGGSISLNQTAFIALQYNYLTGGQMWINNSKIGSRTGGGKLGQTTINSTVSNLNIQGPSTYGGQKVEFVSIYNRELTDNEITRNYNAQKSRFGL